MLYLKLKDIKNREKFFKKEILKIRIKFLFTNILNEKNKSLEFSKFKKDKSANILSYFYGLQRQKNSKTRIVRRCIFNNRSRSSIRVFGISRSLFRELLNFGIIPGYIKAVW